MHTSLVSNFSGLKTNFAVEIRMDSTESVSYTFSYESIKEREKYFVFELILDQNVG